MVVAPIWLDLVDGGDFLALGEVKGFDLIARLSRLFFGAISLKSKQLLFDIFGR